jgi:hypothetical protein
MKILRGTYHVYGQDIPCVLKLASSDDHLMLLRVDLREFLKDQNFFTVPITHILQDILQAVHFLHQFDIVHLTECLVY